jgi:hypothetical protein
MARRLALFAALLLVISCSGAKQNSAPPSHAIVHLNDGTTVSGVVTSSSQTEMVIAGDDGIERKIPMTQVKSVAYEPAAKPAEQPASNPNPQPGTQPAAEPAAPPPVVVKTYELPAGTEVTVATGGAIDSATAVEGQTFAVATTADVKDGNGVVVIPTGSAGSVVIKSASKGGKFKGQSDLSLTLQSVTIGGSPYAVATTDMTQVGKEGVGANKRTAKFVGGAAAVGAVIGGIAGGGKGAAIGAGVGAGAGMAAQVATKGGSIKVPAGTVLTFKLEQPLQVTFQQ